LTNPRREAPAPSRWPRSRASARSIGWGHDGDEASFVGHIERIETQDLAGALHVVTHGDGAFLDVDARVRRGSDLHQGRDQTTTREVAQTVHLDLRVQQCQHQAGHRGAVALQHALELQAFAHGHDGHTVASDVSAEQDRVARLHPGGCDV
jgi:hypothetical protein